MVPAIIVSSGLIRRGKNQLNFGMLWSPFLLETMAVKLALDFDSDWANANHLTSFSGLNLDFSDFALDLPGLVFDADDLEPAARSLPIFSSSLTSSRNWKINNPHFIWLLKVLETLRNKRVLFSSDFTSSKINDLNDYSLLCLSNSFNETRLTPSLSKTLLCVFWFFGALPQKVV